MIERQTWVVRYLLYAGERKMPSSFICTFDSPGADGAAKHQALQMFQKFVLEHKLSVLFLSSEKL